MAITRFSSDDNLPGRPPFGISKFSGPTNKFKDIEACQKALNVSHSEYWSDGVLEYWSIGEKDIKPLAITPSLQYSNTPKLIENKIFQEILPCFDL